jgi:hypothetical protein
VTALLFVASRRRLFWLLAASIAFAALATLYGQAIMSGEPRHGGTRLGIWLGLASLGLILLLLAFGWRKRAYRSTFGTLDGWLQAHLYFGIVALPLVLFHAGFLFRDKLATAAFVVLVLVVATGIVGAFLYRALPQKLTLVDSKVTIDEVSDQLNGLRQAMAQLAAGKSAAFAKLYAKIEKGARPQGLSSWRLLLGAGYAPAGEEKAWRSLLSLVEENEREPLRQLLVLARQQRELHHRLRLQLRYRNWLVVWLVIHVPLSFLLLALSLAHAAVAFYYRGFG